MISIFYNKNTLNDTMTISLSNKFPKEFDRNDIGVKLLDENGDIVGINIFNLSKYIQIDQGYLFLTKTIDDFVQKHFNIDLKKFHSKKFVVAKIKELEEIEGTHLTRCVLDIKSRDIQVVCGGKNLSLNQKVVVALPGVIMPDGKCINSSKLAGVCSEGMICSRRELYGKKEDTDIDGHILVLSDNYNIGDEYVEHYKNFKK